MAKKNLSLEVFVVDNASTDDSVAYLKDKFPWVTFIVNTANIGFGAANNQALQLATGSYILFLNPDTLVPDNCFERIIAFMESDKSYGASGIYMIDGNGIYLPESKRAFPSPLTSLFKLSGLLNAFPKHKQIAQYYLGHLPNNVNNEIEVLSGAFIIMPNNVALKTQGFDTDFFMYGEDIDLSYRIQQLGYKNMLFAETPIIHFKGESTKKNDLGYLTTFYKAMDIFVAKHYKSKKNYLLNPLLKTGIWLRALLALVFSFFKTGANVIFDVCCITASLTATLLFAKYIYELKVSNAFYYWGTIVFLVCYIVLNFINNNYLKRISFAKVIRNSIISCVGAIVACYIQLTNIPVSVLWLQVAATFIITRFLLGNILIKFEWLPAYNHISNQEKLLIVSDSSDFNKVSKILETSAMLHVVIGRVAVDNTDTYLSVGNVDDLLLITKNYPVREILFVAGSKLSYTNIISLMQKLPTNMRFYFTHTQANAIVSSFSKNISGDIIH
jgi:O-antigen biosynthesis protein